MLINVELNVELGQTLYTTIFIEDQIKLVEGKLYEICVECAKDIISKTVTGIVFSLCDLKDAETGEKYSNYRDSDTHAYYVFTSLKELKENAINDYKIENYKRFIKK